MKAKRLVSLGLGAAMLFSMPFGVLAKDGTVDVKGSIVLEGPTVGPDDTYDVTIPAEAQWFVKDGTRPVVVNGKNGVADSKVWADGVAGTDYTVNTITNNSTANINVTFKSFEKQNADATAIENDLVLNLAGGLAVNELAGQNLSKGFNNGGTAVNIGTLAGGGSLGFGFTGQYNKLITNATDYSPTYTMTLGFALPTPTPAP